MIEVYPVKSDQGKSVHFLEDKNSRQALCGCIADWEPAENKFKKCKKCEYLIFKNKYKIKKYV